jgi:formylglycine-generating enzyme
LSLARDIALLLALLPGAAAVAGGRADVPVAGGQFESVLPAGSDEKLTTVAPFRMDVALVSNADFASFVRAHPAWRRGSVAALLADGGYLQHWASAAAPGDAAARKPVTHVSWFAANAYCEARGARLPRWHEWELAAAAGDDVRDARADPVWRQRILTWYSSSARGVLPDTGASQANYYGVRDLHGVAWEWVQDAGSMMVSDDSREQGDPDLDRFCGSGALSLEQKENYALMMRIAMLSSMKASYTSGSMSFRCATDIEARR